MQPEQLVGEGNGAQPGRAARLRRRITGGDGGAWRYGYNDTADIAVWGRSDPLSMFAFVVITSSGMVRRSHGRSLEYR